MAECCPPGPKSLEEKSLLLQSLCGGSSYTNGSVQGLCVCVCVYVLVVKGVVVGL